jgi:hypothetical protein
VAQRARTQRAQEGAHLFAVVPFLFFDLADARPLLGIGEGAPVPAVRVRRRALARVGVLQEADEARAGGGVVQSGPLYSAGA